MQDRSRKLHIHPLHFYCIQLWKLEPKIPLFGIEKNSITKMQDRSHKLYLHSIHFYYI